MNEVIVARVRRGAPMPAKLESFISSQVFHQFRDECVRCRSSAEFESCIQRYNQQQGWCGACSGREVRHSGFSLFLEQIVTLGGFLGATKTAVDRFLYFDMGLLQASRAGSACPATVVVVQQQQPQVAAAQLYNQHHQPQPQYNPTVVQVQSNEPTAPPVSQNSSIPVASPANDVK